MSDAASGMLHCRLPTNAASGNVMQVQYEILQKQKSFGASQERQQVINKKRFLAKYSQLVTLRFVVTHNNDQSTTGAFPHSAQQLMGFCRPGKAIQLLSH